ncbi:hypothetical protein [Embleya sp. NPDC059237]|uniref:hypothetical protein n=1 Tax=Embleya sp. NPDC059237 TaxID=3346784 RepID=UPI003689F18C
MGAGDGRWTASDRAKALAWAAYARSICEGCGTRAAEWDEDRFAYITTTFRCPGCELIDQERAQVPESERGMKVGLIPRSNHDH